MLAPRSIYLCWIPPTVTFQCLEIVFSLSSNKTIPLLFLLILTLIFYVLNFVCMIKCPDSLDLDKHVLYLLLILF